MDEWKKIRKKYFLLEISGIVGIIVCLVLGICLDWNVLVKKNILISINDIESFSLTILQIQATVGTLIIAIIALITGNISDSYMGVSVSDFYLNIKPWKLKQKILIFISLGLCLAEIFFHLLKLYNTVFFLFVATLIAIAISINEIYSAFRGKNIKSFEIEAYIDYILTSDVGFYKKDNIYQNFVLDWQEIIDLQDKQSYEKYLSIFEKCMIGLWEYKTEQSLISIQQQCYSMSYCLLGSAKITTKERGIGFIQKVYEVIWKEIKKESPKGVNILNKGEFYLFSEICSELVQSIDDINVESVEKRIKFDYLSDLILKVAIWSRQNRDEDNDKKLDDSRYYNHGYDNEINELNYFARYLGYYLKKQESKGNIINYNFWSKVLSGWSMFSTSNVPEGECQVFLKAKVLVYFNYCYGMLLYGHENVVKNGLYLTGLRNVISLDNKYQAIFYLSIHCFIYYLAERESDVCVSDKIRKGAKNILEDEKVKRAFESFLDMLAEKCQWLDLSIPKQLYQILERYELFPMYDNVKTMIIENVVLDFYIFLILFMSQQYFLPELLEKNINDMEMFRYVQNGNESKTKEMLHSLFRLIFAGAKSDEKIDVEVDLMYDNLEKTVKRKQKAKYIQLAKKEQREYEVNINEEEICERIRTETIRKIEEQFSSILAENDKQNEVIVIDLLTLDGYTQSVQNTKLDGYYTHIDGMFLFGIIKFLYQKQVAEVKSRFDDFTGDKEFMEYLSINNLHLLLGSQYILKNRDYRLREEYKKFVEDYETIYTADVNVGLALKRNSVQVCLHDVNVSIHSPNIAESDAEYDEKTGRYRYSIINGIPIDFEESELTEFLYNNRKVISVNAEISIQVNEKPCGTIFTGKNSYF